MLGTIIRYMIVFVGSIFSTLSVGGIFFFFSQHSSRPKEKRSRHAVTATCGQRKKKNTKQKMKMILYEIFITHPLLFNGSVVTLSDSKTHVPQKLKLIYSINPFFESSKKKRTYRTIPQLS